MGKALAQRLHNSFKRHQGLKVMAKKKIAWLLVATLVCGCSQDGLEDKVLDRKINEIASSVNNGRQRYKSLDNLNDLLSEFRKCKTRERRLKMVGEFAKRVEENCPRLKNSDYSSYIVVVRRFGLNVGYVITAQEESGEDILVRMDFCCRMIGKYKESCFAIPWTAKATTESEFAFRERLNAAHVLMNEYAEEASSWKRFAFPRIREKLALNVRDEFDKKCAELLSFPDAEDFRRSPMMIRNYL